MGQLFSSEEELSKARDVIGGVLYTAMLEGGAVPNLTVVHPLLLASHSESSHSGPSIQEQMQQVSVLINAETPGCMEDKNKRKYFQFTTQT